MILSEAYLESKAKIASHLASLGWVTENVGPIALGTKIYHTAVGQKEAIAYLVPSDGDSGRFQASYDSEGRNVLSALRASWKAISYAESAAVLAKLAAEFDAEVDAEVSQTYAMRIAAQSEMQ